MVRPMDISQLQSPTWKWIAGIVITAIFGLSGVLYAQMREEIHRNREVIDRVTQEQSDTQEMVASINMHIIYIREMLVQMNSKIDKNTARRWRDDQDAEYMRRFADENNLRLVPHDQIKADEAAEGHQ